MNETDTSSRIGRHMLVVAWVIGLGLLGLFFSDILEKQHNPNRSVTTSITESGVREIVLKRNRQGHYVARGTINGQSVVFLLDTGATVISVPEGVARRLGLRRGAEFFSQTANGTIKTYATWLDEVGIGNIRFNQVAAQINPHFDGDEILLGMSFLKRLDFIQEGDSLTLRQQPRTP